MVHDKTLIINRFRPGEYVEMDTMLPQLLSFYHITELDPDAMAYFQNVIEANRYEVMLLTYEK